VDALVVALAGAAGVLVLARRSRMVAGAADPSPVTA
jgi:hypothetical protein